MKEFHLVNKSDVIVSRIKEMVIETKRSVGDLAFMGNVKPRYVKILNIKNKRATVCDLQGNNFHVYISSLTLEPKILDKPITLLGDCNHQFQTNSFC
ncbi:hypothetical protein ACFSFY_12490 [Sporosarcina siberiensis]|uniref:Uncharacterized protein n=1 Tax=Sporosarcina siberiensis TaxID=1365606 RepID=A0ABW4SID0_9BACL